ATVRGYQGDDLASPHHVAACLKHYVGYSGPTSGHDRTPALFPETVLREYYLPTFRAAIDAGAASVMINSGEVNGIPGHANHFLLTTVLRKEMGFDGVAVSDWEDIKKLVTHHRVAANEKEATRMAVMAGIDMSMVPSDYSFADLLLQLVNEGAVPVSRIDEAVRRILVMKARLGLFRDPLTGIDGRGVGSPSARALSLQAARESITLLKNTRNVLPLARGARILVTGPTADSLIALNNGWTYTWQGDRPALYPADRPTIVAAIRQRVSEANVTYVPGVDFKKEIDLAAVTSAAQTADVIVLCLGESSYTETPGDIDDLALPAPQRHLAEVAAATGKPVVLVLVEGRPRLINDFAEAMSGIVLAYNPSNEGGAAVTDILFGDVNPSGRLPFTYPRYSNSLLTYDRKLSESSDTSFGLKAYNAQFEFGFGLSYTTFEYSGLEVSPRTVATNGPVSVKVTVRNTGDRAGAEVVQLYLRDRVASITPSVRRLKRFARLWLAPGESRQASFTLTRDDFSFIGADNRPTVEAGDFDVMVGSLTSSFALTTVPGRKQPSPTKKESP
ncbi:MAG: glycoside hydrolase family 3 C-terminal domain-containing protein, partial [Acidobacteriota bacterium]|nr:glycoside hydrolase family 3 C-terminal domain-containing protein [Acidobacteriota bacterium]